MSDPKARASANELGTAPTVDSGSGPRGVLTHLEPGTVLDGVYRIERSIGAGGMGAVYLATHIRLQRTFAVKVVVPARADDEESVRRLEQEARSASAIDHENIVAVTHLGRTEDGAVFVVMEALEGEDLRQRLVKEGDRGHLPDAEARAIVDQTLDAIGAAHAAGIVHRDLKPENLFLDRRRNRQSLKIVDFGISKLRSADDDVRLTQRGQVLGTPLYMAPEQGRDTANADHRADLYSIGCIAYELLTGRVPFEGRTAYECLVAHATDTPRPVHEARPDVPRTVSKWISKSLAKDPKDRFQSAAEMRAAWAEAWAAQPQRTAGGVVVIALVALTLLAIPLVHWLRSDAPADEAPGDPEALVTDEPIATDEPAAPPREPEPIPLGVAPPEPAPSVVRELVTEPAGAEVWIEDEQVGTTPWSAELSPGQTLSVELRRRGFRTEQVDVAEGDPPSRTVRLVRRGLAMPDFAPR